MVRCYCNKLYIKYKTNTGVNHQSSRVHILSCHSKGKKKIIKSLPHSRMQIYMFCMYLTGINIGAKRILSSTNGLLPSCIGWAYAYKIVRVILSLRNGQLSISRLRRYFDEMMLETDHFLRVNLCVRQKKKIRFLPRQIYLQKKNTTSTSTAERDASLWRPEERKKIIPKVYR